jgi:putative peptidoglycan lipid II flippase
MDESVAPSNQRIARAAGTVMLAFLFSQLTGLAAKILIGAAFPAGFDLDAFYVANQPSESLLTIMAGGILVSSFIPVFVKFLVRQESRSAWILASATANLILIIMTILAGLEAILARPIVLYLLGAGFSPEKQALTIVLLRIQAISIVFFGLSGLLVGILNAHQKFLMSALSPAMYNLGQIFGVLVLAPHMGIYGLAWGVVLGSALGLLIQVPALARLRGHYIPTLGRHNPAVGEVFRLMAPRMFGAAVVQLMVWVNTLLASHMADGSVYSLRIGFSLMMLAWAVIAQSIATAAMPTFSAQYAQGKMDEIRKTLASTLRGVLLLAVPATFGLVLLRVPIITLVFQRQQFTPETTQMVAWALLWYTVGLVFHSVLEVLVRAYYAMHDTRTPVAVGAAAMVLSIGLSLVFSTLFTRLGWSPHGGLALAVSLSTALEVSTLFLLMRRRLNGIHGLHIAKGFATALLGTLGLCIALVFWLKASSFLPVSVVALGGVAIGGLAYGMVMLILRVPEVTMVLNSIKQRLGGKRPAP